MLSFATFRTLQVSRNGSGGVMPVITGCSWKSPKWDSTRSLKTTAHIKLELFSTPSTSSFFKQLVASRRKLFGVPSNMDYFVIGVSGITCGGKTSLTKLLQQKFPRARVIHQDHYFRDDDWPNHVRSPEAENHVNYEVFQALDMDKMYKDVQIILEGPPEYFNPSPGSKATQPDGDSEGVGDKAETPNFDNSFLNQIKDIDVDVSRFGKLPILIIEGFTIFGSKFLFDKCHARFFCTLDKETCRKRRLLRSYFPPDTPSYFDKVIWPEYEKHFNEFVHKRDGITVFDGDSPMEKIWKDSVQIVACRIEEKYGDENFRVKTNDMIV